MRLILTHEQADFDALASMLGVYLLDNLSIPVLPRRLNRNVRAFITLYGAELPFVDPRDLPAEAVESICLVDTQTMATFRGVLPDTSVHIIDHHDVRNNLPSHWTIVSENVGATVTVLVEQLQSLNIALSMIHATLLLLGIYEDTGSLTYTRTTSRDLNAASFLLEQGANLSQAGNFLNHPLSVKQQHVYDLLLKSVESIDIHGNRILLACGDAGNLDEELSTVAHKLRDTLDPDALFVLVTTQSGVQLICRSTTDNVDVAEIAICFGGGGHSRASASLIRGKSLDEVKAELIDHLSRYVQPAVTVAEIMSLGPQIISPETPVQQAAERMRRYGYEGYPVVKDGKVVGLLTRRAVDRALSHKLNLTARSLMNAGEVSVHPEDSIEHLQHLMTDTGWGQIPVIRKEDGIIIGIVTRTDLLKTLTDTHVRPGQINLAERLDPALPPARLALLKAVCDVALEQHVALYVVGGFVRDLLLDRPSLDFDLVVEGDAIALAHVLGRRFGGRVTAHPRFGTAKWLIAPLGSDIAVELGYPGSASELPEFLDLISARTEFYTHPTALPTVESGNIKLDLHRRDFTINTLAMRLDGNHYGELYDYWGGLVDLRSKLVRVLHSLSFVDDPTRMLRAVRFEQRFGFCIENRTLELLHEALSLLSRVSGERIKHELDHILDEENRLLMFERLNELHLLKSVHEKLTWDDTISACIKNLYLLSPDEILAVFPGVDILLIRKKLAYMLWLIQLPELSVRSILSRIKFPPSQIDDVMAACRLYSVLPSIIGKKVSQIVSILDSYPKLAVYGNYLKSDEEEPRTIVWQYLTEWRYITPQTNGYILHSRGVPRGPIYRQILDALRSAWLDDEIVSAQEEAVLLNQLLSAENLEPPQG